MRLSLEITLHTSQTSNSIELAEGNAVSAVTGIGRRVISWIGRYFSCKAGWKFET